MKIEDGHKTWRNEAGQFHRSDGPAIIDANGTQKWCIDGKCHRVDGPAITYADGSQAWYINGMYHRLDGPAVIRADGNQEWRVNGNYITPEVNKWIDQMNIDPDYTLWTDTHKIMFRLAFAGS